MRIRIQTSGFFGVGFLCCWMLILLCSGCFLKKSESSSHTLRVRLKTEPPSLDWHRASDTTSREVILNIMEPLLDYGFDQEGAPYLKPALCFCAKAISVGVIQPGIHKIPAALINSATSGTTIGQTIKSAPASINS